MKNEVQLSPKVIYELIAYVGFRKSFHLGGLKATKELVELCHIGKGKYVLDVGCGTGKTACYIAKEYGCKVMGIDILEKMIDRLKERAKREKVEDKVEFVVADAQNLPFRNDVFDIVIGEFITGLLDDKEKGVNEYLRVAKAKGYIGLNEATWIKTPPAELAEYISRTYGVKDILTPGKWKKLLLNAGLKDITIRIHKASALYEKLEALKDFLRVWHKVLYFYIKSSAFRKFIKEALSLPKDFLEYWGYGIYVGRK